MTDDRWLRVKRLFEAAVERPASERSAFVSAAVAGDDTLRREVAALLAADGTPEEISEQWPVASVSLLAGLRLGLSASGPGASPSPGLAAGSRLGNYTVVAPLGAGGMGEVYRARDARLGRDVAIKILPRVFTSDPERLARFEREARVLASLNHPHIAGIYGIEDTGTAPALVLELVDGPTLAERVSAGALGLDEVLAIGRQMADALSAAHDKGIVHRDLKPANVKLTPTGVVKVLDFGLAKPTADVAAPELTHSPTITVGGTREGLILGTAAYMSPEQARGKSVDKRADIWAFGCVVYEMLTGRKAFEGETVSDTLAAILEREPNWKMLPAVTPANVRRLLRRCLEKNVGRRLRDIGDASLEIEDELTSPADASAQTVSGTLPAVSSWTSRKTLAAFVLGAVLAGAAALILSGARAPENTFALRYTPLSFERGGQQSPVWSPDGKAIAFAARQAETDRYQVYVRYLDSSVATPITHVDEGANPIQWTSAGRIIFSTTGAPAGLWSISPVGGEPVPLLDLSQVDFQRAAVSRDGNAAAFAGTTDGVFGLWISSPPGAPPTRYEPAPFAGSGTAIRNLAFSPNQSQILLFLTKAAGEEGWLLPYPYDPARPPRRVLEKLPTFDGPPTFSWMPDNRSIIVSTSTGDGRSFYVADTATGDFHELSSATTWQDLPAVSPDGSRFVMRELVDDLDVVSIDMASAAVTPVIATLRLEEMAVWAAAAERPALAYVTDRNGAIEIWLHQPGQSDRPLVTARDFPTGTTQWLLGPVLSPDASRVIYWRVERGGGSRLWISALSGGPPVRLVKGTSREEVAGSWSPNGNWFVYFDADKSNALMKVKTSGEAVPEMLKSDVRRTDVRPPVWSPDGEWILYADAGLQLVSPDGKTTRRLDPEAPLCAFARDGARLYCLASGGNGNAPWQLFSMNLHGTDRRTIGTVPAESAPATQFGSFGLRLALTPDGKGLSYSVRSRSSNLWLVEGLSAAAR
jgi:serine/threonine protein kinase/Tol biopolymer transport system component